MAETRLVALGVPTYCRPEFLRRCLDSIARLDRPQSVVLHLLLLDNNPGGDARAVFDELAPSFDFPATYVHVKERGIPAVRNQAIATALSMDADFIAFLDDDEVAPSEWLLEMVRALDAYDADVVAGPKARILPDGAPEWMKRSKRLGEHRADRDGPAEGSVSTCNVLFGAKLVDDWGLRFRLDYTLTGGSDTVFFEEARRRGATIVWASKARIHEWVPASRARLAWMLRRDFRTGVNRLRRERLFDGEWAAWRLMGFWLWSVAVVRPIGLVRKELGRGPRRAFRGAGFARRGVKYLSKLAKALGMLAGLFGYRYEEYRAPAHGR